MDIIEVHIMLLLNALLLSLTVCHCNYTSFLLTFPLSLWTISYIFLHACVLTLSLAISQWDTFMC